jgi:HPt (histidine-containing phosphotransfer) domain-containing protein
MGGKFSNLVNRVVQDPASSRSPEAARTVAVGRASQQRTSLAHEGQPPLDRDLLTRRCLGRLDLVDRLLKSFESRFPGDLSRIEDCLQANDFEELSRLVHQAKGAAANISAPELHSNMSRLEQALKMNHPEMTSTCLADIHRAWDRFLEFKCTMETSGALSGRN